MDQKIVVHFKDGQVFKGTSHDFFPNKDCFHLTELGQSSQEKPVEIRFSQLKAVFFVKDYEGNKAYQKVRSFTQAPKSSYGKKAIVHFNDKEVLCGFTQGYVPNRPGFFLFPVDTEGNNLKVFILQAFVAKVEFPK